LDEKRRTPRLVFAGAAAVLLISIVATYSRGAFLDMMILAVLIALDRKVKPYYIVAGALVFFVVIVPLLPPEYQARIGTLNVLTALRQSSSAESVRSINEASFEGRTSEAIVAWQMFLDHPILGVGIGNYPHRYLEYAFRLGIDMRGQMREAHSLYLEAAATTGILGITALFALLVATFVGQAQSIKLLERIGRPDLVSWVKGTRLGVMGFLITSIFLHAAFARYLWMLLGLAAAAEVVAQREYLRFREARRRQGQMAPLDAAREHESGQSQRPLPTG
jgi:O-antigen ligase